MASEDKPAVAARGSTTTAQDAEKKKRARIAAYDKVVEAAELRFINLMDLNFAVSPEFFEEGKRSTSLKYNVKFSGVTYEDGSNIAAAHIVIDAFIKKSRKKTLTFKVSYVAVYDGLKDCGSEAVTAFLSRVAPFACYPYARALFANLNWEAGLRLPPMPVHKERKR